MYNLIFFTNILRLLEEQGMTKQELSARAGVSISFLSDLTNGKANPSLRVMESIANALDVPLPTLLETTDMDENSLILMANGRPAKSLPPGYKRISVVLSEQQAFTVRKWGEMTKAKLSEEARHMLSSTKNDV
ncbi:transcriptional regulator [Pantoea agglomerans]|uniref:transcriptional regulator n=1 Tax=Enterobacter agglomerans TaxID=549 RepID=UPI003C7CAE10